MSRYTTTLDIWAMTEAERKAIHPGQWVRAGEALGRYLGQKPGGSDVVLWKRSRHSLGHMKALRAYATAQA